MGCTSLAMIITLRTTAVIEKVFQSMVIDAIAADGPSSILLYRGAKRHNTGTTRP